MTPARVTRTRRNQTVQAYPDSNGSRPDRVVVRSVRRRIVTLVALLFGPLFMLGPVAIGVVLLYAVGFSLNSQSVLVLCFSVGGSAFFAYHMLQNYHWVEFDGEVIRGRRFWTRQYVEHRISNATQLLPLKGLAASPVNTVIDSILGPVRGVEIRFQHGPRVALIRHDMTNVDQLIKAVIDRRPDLVQPGRH